MLVPSVLAALVGISVTSFPPASGESEQGVPATDSPAEPTEPSVPDPEPTPDREAELRALMASCDQALGAGNCTSLEANPTSPFRALIRFSENGVVVTLRTGATPVVRQLTFSTEDGVAQRRAAAGLLVAAMTAAAHLAARSPPHDTPAEPAVEEPAATTQAQKGAPPTSVPPSQTATAKRQDAPANQLSFELGAVASPLLGTGVWSLGGLARFTVWPTATVGVSGETRVVHGTSSPVSTDTLLGALGLPVSLWSQGNIDIRAHPQAVVDLTRVSIAGASTAKSATRFGARLAFSIAFNGRLGPWLGVGLTALTRPLKLERNNEPFRAIPPFSADVALGIRWEP